MNFDCWTIFDAERPAPVRQALAFRVAADSVWPPSTLNREWLENGSFDDRCRWLAKSGNQRSWHPSIFAWSTLECWIRHLSWTLFWLAECPSARHQPVDGSKFLPSQSNNRINKCIQKFVTNLTMGLHTTPLTTLTSNRRSADLFAYWMRSKSSVITVASLFRLRNV